MSRQGRGADALGVEEGAPEGVGSRGVGSGRTAPWGTAPGGGGPRSPGARWGLLAGFLLASPVLVGIGYALAGAWGFAGAGSGAAATPGEGALGAWPQVVANRATWEGIGWSLWVAGASTALSTLLAMGLAVVFRGEGRLDGTARALALLPLPIPHLVAAVGAVLVLGQSGILARMAHAMGLAEVPADLPALVTDPWGMGMILALVWKEVPFLALVAFSILASRGTALEEAARTLGAGPWATFRHVTLPVLWRGMLPAVVAVFAFVVGSWEVAVLLAPSDPLALPLQIMERHTDPALARRGEAWVLVLLALGLAAALVALHERLRARWGVLSR